jgi:glutamine synthetase
MPRWTEKADSQSIHLHISLKDKEGQPLFWDANEKNGVSQKFRHFIGGLQTYIGDLTLRVPAYGQQLPSLCARHLRSTRA